MDDECKHGLEVAWCAACKEGLKRNPPDTADWRFVARYDGHCPECDLPIHVGQRAAKTTKDRTLHESCLPS